MGNKILTVEINADTGKFEAKLKELPTLISKQADAAKLIKQLDEQRTIVLQKNASAIKDAYEKIRNTTEKVKELNSAFQLGAMNASLVSINKNLSDMSKQLSEIAAKRKALDEVRQAQNMASTLGALTTDEIYNRRSGPYRPSQQFGTVAESRLRFEKEANEAYANLIKQTQEEITRKEKEELRKQEFAAKASYNARYQMYAAMFDQIEEKRKRTDFSTLGQNIFRPKSDTAIRLTQGLSEAGRAAELKKQEEAAQALANKNKELEKTHRSLTESVIYSTTIYKAYTTALHLTEQALLNIPRVGIQYESTIASLTASFGSLAGAFQEMTFLSQEAERTGINLNQLRESYQKAAASFIAAGQSADTTREIFSNINTVITTLHLNSQETGSIYLALSQIFNKTKLQAEELTKQLSQTIPGVTNEQAKALGITVSELYDKMKKGAISANDAVLALSKTLAATYGGTAFERATKGLNSELGRLNNAWTTLSETVYKATSEMMISVVRFATETTNNFNKAIGSSFELRRTLTDLGLSVAGFIAGLASARIALVAYESYISLAAKGTTSLTKATELLTVTLKRGIFTAAIVEAGVYLAKLQELKLAQIDVDSYIERQKGAPAPGVDSPAYTAEQDFRVREAKAALEAQQKLEKEAGERTVESKKKIDFLLKNLQDTRKQVLAELQRTADSTRGGVVKEATDVTKEIAEAQEIYLKGTGQKLEGLQQGFLNDNKKRIDKLMQAYAEGNQEAGEALQKLQEAYSGLGQKQIGNLAIQQITDELQVNKRAQDKLQAENEAYFQQNIISFEQFFKRKLELYQNDYEARKFLLEKGAEEAAGIEPAKESDFRGKLQELEEEQAQRIASLEKARFEASIADNKKLTDIAQEYYSLIGDNERAVSIQLSEKYGLIKNSLQTQIELGLENRKVALSQIEAIERIAKAEASVQQAKELVAANDARYEQQLNRVNILKNIGAISELTAAKQITDINRNIIANKEEEIALAEKLLAVQEKGSSGYDLQAEKIRKIKEELDQFKLTADTTAQFFETKLGNAFESAFVDFATGATNATQAFQNFGKSIVAEIAKIAAQEARSAIIGGLFKMGLSALGGIFSGADMFGASSTGRIISPVPQAKGGINTGMGIGNGVVLSSATYFPQAKPTMFASGGVVAGEAGYEAALPLKRTRSGKLGVSVEGQQQSGNVVNINVSVDRSKGQNDEAYAAMIAEKIARKVSQEEIAKNARNKTYSSSATKYG